ncbi:MAG: FtsX-like permease family protein [Bifidobacterium sp.]|nr:FtsX-like permease family protein [Bifidobacterium sp.]
MAGTTKSDPRGAQDAPRGPRASGKGGRGHAVGGAFVLGTLRSWLHSWRPFLSILVISLLGVAVLTGIYAGCRDTFLAADRFYDQQGLHDVQVLSTMGLDDEDVAALKEIKGVKAVQATRSQSVRVEVDGKSRTATIQEIGSDGIDQPYLQEGKLPTKAGEVAVTKKFLNDSGLHIGSTIDVTADDTSGDDSSGISSDSTDDSSAPSFPTHLTIVGVVIDPSDLTNPDGYSSTTSSSFRSSASDTYTLFAPSDGVTGSTYTAVSLTVDGAAALDTFDEDYSELTDTVAKRIENDVMSTREQARLKTLKDDAQQKLDDTKTKTYADLDDAAAKLKDQRAQLEEQQAQVDAQLSLYGLTEATAPAQLASAVTQIKEATAKLDQADKELAANRTKADEEFAKQQKTIDDLATPRWYVQTRSALGGFGSLKSDINSIENIGKAFPVLFLIVAIMMSLTTMSRLVEEDRGLVGTYFGLGYGRLAIVMRYVLFALLGCLIGCGLGLLAGFLGIPAFLLVVIKGLYTVPDLRLEYDWLTGSLGVLLFVVGVVGATVIAIWRELRQMPAALMRPRAPKPGARILLERIRPLWRRMNFLNKVTARNIFRFKSRLIMTVGGVAGCTALIVCGLAINDTVAVLGSTQFDQIDQYDMMVVSNEGDATAMRERVVSDGKTTAIMDAMMENGELTNTDGHGETIQLVVIPEKQLAELNEMLQLEPPRSDSIFGWVGSAFGHGEKDTSITLDDSGVIVAQSAAQSLGIKAGQQVSLRPDGSVPAKTTVHAITRNLLGSQVYISEDLYKQLFPDTDSSGSDSDAITWNTVFAKLKGDDSAQKSYVKQLEDDGAVMTAVSTAQQQEDFKFDLMGAVVALIVGCAGALALVVLFTLAHTNVSERVREMATLKVLGFYDKEVHRYIDREMMVMTLMGIVIGLPLGRWLAALMTSALAMPSMYFEVYVSPWSYVVAAAATLVFAVLVQLFVNPVLDRIDPVSSLKSVE